jgi:hypothetical protein
MAVPAVAGLMAWRRYSGGEAGRAGYGFALFLLIVSMPLHLGTAFTWSTAYLTAFPTWYSVVEIPIFLALIVIVSRLRFASTPHAHALNNAPAIRIGGADNHRS